MHPPIRAACLKALSEIFGAQKHAEKIVEFNLKTQKKWGARDRRQFAETVYDIVRWFRLLSRLAGVPWEPERPLLAVEAYMEVLETYLLWKADPRNFETAIAQLPFVERESIPDWLDERGRNELGPVWEKTLQALNQQAPQFLRVNNLKATLPQAVRELSEAEVATEEVAGVPTALRLKERKNVFQTAAYKKGYFEMQDAGSQLIAPLLRVEPGARVVDACAGAGGKTLHLAALMANKGKIIALDIHDWKLNELKTRAARAGISIVEIREIESTKVIKRLHESADFVLLDVPCSGLGVLRRHPDTKWKLNPRELERLHALQDDLLERYTEIARVGGVVVYATCSILPSENDERVRAFLSRREGAFALEEELKVSPFETPFDGFYAARLRRLR